MSNFLDTTAGSTGATNVAITTYMPPEHAKEMFAICDRCQAAEAEVQRLTPDDKHARDCKSQQKEALVLAALDNATLHADVVEAGWCHRTGLVLKHLRKHGDRYNIDKPPCYKTVKAILKKHGYL